MGYSFTSEAIRRGCRGASGKPPCIASLKDNFAARDSPRWGLTRRLWRVGMACSPMGRSIASDGDPKGCRGERREARAQWAQPPKAVSDPEFRQTTSRAHGSANRADCLPRGKPPVFSRRLRPEGGAGGRAESPHARLCLHELSGIMALSQRRGCHHGEITASA